jgi:hypothetical protein
MAVTSNLFSLVYALCASSSKKSMLFMLLIFDLKRGKDGFSGEEPPFLGELGLPSEAWTQIAMATEDALIDCAKSNNVYAKALVIQKRSFSSKDGRWRPDPPL